MRETYASEGNQPADEYSGSSRKSDQKKSQKGSLINSSPTFKRFYGIELNIPTLDKTGYLALGALWATEER